MVKGVEMNRGGFSWKRLLGFSAAKSRASRRIGVPLTRGGRLAKAGKAFTRKGSLLSLIMAWFLD